MTATRSIVAWRVARKSVSSSSGVRSTFAATSRLLKSLRSKSSGAPCAAVQHIAPVKLKFALGADLMRQQILDRPRHAVGVDHRLPLFGRQVVEHAPAACRLRRASAFESTCACHSSLGLSIVWAILPVSHAQRGRAAWRAVALGSAGQPLLLRLKLRPPSSTIVCPVMNSLCTQNNTASATSSAVPPCCNGSAAIIFSPTFVAPLLGLQHHPRRDGIHANRRRERQRQTLRHGDEAALADGVRQITRPRLQRRQIGNVDDDSAARGQSSTSPRACAMKNGPRRFVSMTRAQSSGVMSSAG